MRDPGVFSGRVPAIPAPIFLFLLIDKTGGIDPNAIIHHLPVRLPEGMLQSHKGLSAGPADDRRRAERVNTGSTLFEVQK